MAEQNKININYLHTLALQESETDTIQEIDSNLYNSISDLIKNLKSEGYDGVKEKINQAMIKMISDTTSMLLKLRLEKATLESSHQSVLLDEEKYILITHGTDTMCETAKLLGESSIDKTIVLFGSMVPYAVNGSDAFFNFGCALGSVQLLKVGVYIAMNGRILPWNDVEKNRSLGIFQTLHS